MITLVYLDRREIMTFTPKSRFIYIHIYFGGQFRYDGWHRGVQKKTTKVRKVLTLQPGPNWNPNLDGQKY